MLNSSADSDYNTIASEYNKQGRNSVFREVESQASISNDCIKSLIYSENNVGLKYNPAVHQPLRKTYLLFLLQV